MKYALLLVLLTALPTHANELQPHQEAEAALKTGSATQAQNILNQAFETYPDSSLRPYWLYLLAQAMPQRAELPRGTPAYLEPHFHWWRAMATPKNVCQPEAFAAYARTARLSQQLPQIGDSTEIQERLGCMSSLPEAARLQIASVLQDYRFFWLTPRLLESIASAEGYYYRGLSRLERRQYKPAYEDFQRVLQAPPAQAAQVRKPALIEAGYAQVRLGQDGAALKLWASISPQDPEYYPEVLWQQAQLHLRRNRDAQARPLLQSLYQRFPNHKRAPEAAGTLLRQAVKQNATADITALSNWLHERHPDHEESTSGRYWGARALEKSGHAAAARQQFEQLAQGPLNDYYTHLADCRLSQRDCFQIARQTLQPQPPSADTLPIPETVKALATQGRPEALRILAPFLQLPPATADRLRSLAYLREGNYFRSIRTIWRYKTRDPEFLRLMYPLHYYDTLVANAQRYQLPHALVAGLAWQESMYKADIRSSAGATGLMQLMPATAQGIAGKAEVKNFQLSQLTQPEVNVRLGTYYLRENLNRWNGAWIPTIASYNAGPNAVARWVQQFGNLEREAFVEQIPYEETRRYVKQVLAHAWVYNSVY
jgi:soluble lytic murein transglycosylase